MENAAAKDTAYFAYYGMLTHQQNMMQDQVRTNAYFQAIMNNSIDFTNSKYRHPFRLG